MATIIDPLGTPVVVYNKSGTALIEVSANGFSPATATPIPYVCGHQIVMVTTLPPDENGANHSVVLPVDAVIGDVVEVFQAVLGETPAPIVWVPDGESINLTVNGSVLVTVANGIRFIKTGASSWHSIG